VVSGKNSIFLIIFVSLIAATPAAFMESQSAGIGILQPHAAVVMVLIGFLFVSLVIDRRFGLATMNAPLHQGQMGFHFIPQLASKISRKYIRRKSLPKSACQFHLEDSCRLRSDIESTQHIDFLHHLAGSISDDRLFLINISMRDKHQQEHITIEVPQLPITHFSSLPHPALIRTAPRAKQNLSFSPGFIFVRLARGPPNLT
jgi:hypothetical protein